MAGRFVFGLVLITTPFCVPSSPFLLSSPLMPA
jgi:hypothetical protein